MTLSVAHRLLLLQIRNENDAMRDHEHACFAARIGVPQGTIDTWNLPEGPPPMPLLESAEAVLIGGSGDYSVVRGGTWLPSALDTMRRLVSLGIPTFASCWGFQAMSLALGGQVEHLPHRGHVGTFTMQATAACRCDPLLGTLGSTFSAQFGHEDVVTAPPDGACVLVQSDAGDCMAWRLGEAMIWGTQFHPELSHEDLLLRLRRYPQYVRDILGMSMDEFEATRIAPSPDADHLPAMFVELVRARAESGPTRRSRL